MKWRPVAVLLCSMAVATSASAQDAGQYAGLFAGVVETLGQGVGDAVTGGPGLFVTATGHADLPAPLADAYTVQIEGRSKSAVEAAQQRDDRLKSGVISVT